MLDRAPRAITIVTALVIGFSVFYDWLYFLIIDPRFFALLQIGDHVSASLERIPIFAIGCAAAALVIFAPSKREEEGTVDIAADPVTRFPIFSVGDYIIFLYPIKKITLIIFTTIYVAMIIFVPHSWYLLFIVFNWWWERIGSPIMKRLWEWDVRWAVFPTYFIPVLAAFAVSTAIVSAHNDTAQTDGTIEIRKKSSQQLVGLVLLRSAERGLIVRNPKTRRNFFLNWSTIDHVERKKHYDPRSLGCSWFNLCWTKIDKKLTKYISDSKS